MENASKIKTAFWIGTKQITYSSPFQQPVEFLIPFVITCAKVGFKSFTIPTSTVYIIFME